ncbi:hypothetical protein EMIT036CA2_50166 [Chryseobacterium sp. IT-36CA2]
MNGNENIVFLIDYLSVINKKATSFEVAFYFENLYRLFS